MIERNQVDVGITSFYANSGRGQVVDFSLILEVAEYFDKSIEFVLNVWLIGISAFLDESLVGSLGFSKDSAMMLG